MSGYICGRHVNASTPTSGRTARVKAVGAVYVSQPRRDVAGVVETGSCGPCLNLLANSSIDVVVASHENDGAWRWF